MKKNPTKLKGKRILAVYALLAMFGVSTVASAAGNISYEAMHTVRNKTNNETTYRAAASAKPGDEMRVMVYYHNKENENSGINAQNLNIKVALPTTEGTGHVSTATVSGSNIATIVDTAVINTNVKTKLEYVAGSATRKFNTGTNAVPNWQVVSVDDSIVGGGYNIASQKPCYNFEESIVITVKVIEVEKPKPVCTLVANPTSVKKGNSSTLSYTTTNATSASIDQGVGNVVVGSGSNQVTPASTTTYTLTANGEGGTVICDATVTVTEKPVIPEEPKHPETPVVITTGKGNMPTSGPAEAAAGAIGLTSTGGAAWAYLRSKKNLLGALKKIK